MKRCEKCGYKIRSGIKVCTECGTKQTFEEKLKKKPAQELKKSLPKKKRKPIPTPDKALFIKRVRVFAAVFLILLMFIGIAYYFLNERYSPDNILGETAQAVEARDSEALAGVVSNDMTKDEADAYLKYIDSTIGRQEYVNRLTELEAGSQRLADENFILMELVSKGQALLIFNEYEVKIPEYEVGLDSDIEEGEVTYTHGNQNLKWNISETTFGNLVPGIYNIDATLNSGGNEFNSDIVIDFNEVDDENVSGRLLLNAYYADLQMGIYETEYGIPLEDIVIYINDQKMDIDFDKDGNAIYGPLNYDQSYQFTAEVNYEGEDFEADAVDVNHTKKNEVAGSNYVVPLKFDRSSINNHLVALDEEETVEEEKEKTREERRKQRVEEKQDSLAKKDAEGKEVSEKEPEEQGPTEETSYEYYMDVAFALDDEMMSEVEDLYDSYTPSGFYGGYYEEWDSLLNEVWGVIKDTLPNAEFEELKLEQIEWIQTKEEKFNEGSHDVTSERSDSMDQLTVKTRDRTYYLIGHYLE